ncbi:MAG: DNA primase [Nitrospirae bacterium RIFCSPLOWO2_02_FULL_62_14]|nr:MAG: DNA primase [Nitrospirae bacterium RIFCSPLOWO2_02_FULL_62_14]
MSLGLIPQEIIEQVKDRTDILDVVSGYVTLSKAGQNFKGLCPFHSEKTPSFMVSPSRQIFHCFGCGTGGNAFTFVMKMEGTSFPETVRELARKAGIAVPEAQGAPRGVDAGGRHHQDSGNREKLEKLNEAAQAWFAHNLTQAEAGREARLYLKERGMFEDTLETFGFGYAPESWDGLLKHLLRSGYTLPDVLAAGLITTKEGAGRNPKDASGYYDKFRARVMFPIRDLRRKVIGFGGRILGEGMPKYLNSPETPLFNKSRALYLLEKARETAGKTETLIIVEGYFDAIALHQAGITNVVATLGTALTPDHIRIIRRYVTKAVLLFDPDEAGVRAALRTLDLFVDSGLGVKVVSLPSGDDPDTFIRNQGTEVFAQLHDKAPSLLDFAVEHSLRRAGSTVIEDRIRSVDEILRILQKTSNRLEKEEYTKRVAERLGVNQQRLIERYPELRPRELRPARRESPAAAAPPAGARFKGTPEERDLVHLLLQGQLLPAEVLRLEAETFSMPACRRIVEIALRSLDEGRVSVRATLDEALADMTCATVATELSMLDQPYDDVRQHVTDCLDLLERKKLEGTLGRLIAELRAAEQAGRTDEAQRLNDEVNALRLRKSGRATVSAAPGA